jgi:uracil-DNA glycosylase family 4
MARDSLRMLSGDIVGCRACPRLVAWRERVAREKVARFRDFDYWGRPVPGFGDPDAWLLIVGLAPGAHGANRTGRMFTGDRSGDFLYAALHRAGLASQAESRTRDDGLALRGAYILATIRCAPPGNKPEPAEIARCAPFFDREVRLLPKVRVVLALGAIAWRAYLDHMRRCGVEVPRPSPAFAHGAEVAFGPRGAGLPPLIGSYHVSQQNTQTGKLTPAMFDAILAKALLRRGDADR